MEHQIRGQMTIYANKMVRDVKDYLYPTCPPITNQYLARARISIFAFIFFVFFLVPISLFLFCS